MDDDICKKFLQRGLEKYTTTSRATLAIHPIMMEHCEEHSIWHHSDIADMHGRQNSSQGFHLIGWQYLQKVFATRSWKGTTTSRATLPTHPIMMEHCEGVHYLTSSWRSWHSREANLENEVMTYRMMIFTRGFCNKVLKRTPQPPEEHYRRIRLWWSIARRTLSDNIMTYLTRMGGKTLHVR